MTKTNMKQKAAFWILTLSSVLAVMRPGAAAAFKVDLGIVKVDMSKPLAPRVAVKPAPHVEVNLPAPHHLPTQKPELPTTEGRAADAAPPNEAIKEALVNPGSGPTTTGASEEPSDDGSSSSNGGEPVDKELERKKKESAALWSAIFRHLGKRTPVPGGGKIAAWFGEKFGEQQAEDSHEIETKGTLDGIPIEQYPAPHGAPGW